MGFKADQKEYYESELQRRVLYIPNLSMFLSDLNKQMLKLPHENQDPNSDRPSGCTEEDIHRSIYRGVENLYVMLAPVRLLLANKKDEPVEFTPKDQKKFEAKDVFAQAMEKLEWCYVLMEEGDVLNDRLVNENLPGDDDVYDYGGAEDGTNKTTGAMPASLQPPDDAKVGRVEKEVPK